MTLQGLQGRPTVLCAVPLGYCLVHADPLRGQPSQALEKELEQELTQGRDLVTQDTLDSLDSDGSDTGEEPSGRNVRKQFDALTRHSISLIFESTLYRFR